MLVHLVTPAPRGALTGNRVTAERWAALLGELGHRPLVAGEWRGEPCDLLVALHARRSYPSVARYRDARPRGPLVVALTGTDLYGDLGTSTEAARALEWADRLVALQDNALEALAPAWRRKARVVLQSVRLPPRLPPPPEAVGDGGFVVCQLAHLRPVKDPFRVACAARLLPASSRLRVVHAGRALDPGMADEARAEEAANPRYRWLGPLPRHAGLALLAASRLLVLSSRTEGGANVISEAIVTGTPVLASGIPGSTGLLGEGYPGLFAVGDTGALARLLERAESDAGFLRELAARCAERVGLFDPAREREAWRSLLAELSAIEV